MTALFVFKRLECCSNIQQETDKPKQVIQNVNVIQLMVFQRY